MTEARKEKQTYNMENTNHTFDSSGIARFGERLLKVIDGEPYKSFAKKCGMSDKAIRDYVNGETYPALDRIAQIAEVTGCSFEWLVTGSVQGAKGDVSIIDADSTEWHKIFERMTKEERELMINFVARNGINSIIPNELTQRAKTIAELILSLNDDDQREILLLIEGKKLGSLLNNKSTRKTA